MKAIHLIYFVAILSTIAANSFAQTWDLLGNPTTNPLIHFVGTQDASYLNITTNNNQIGAAQPIYFNTNGAACATVAADNNFGIGTTAASLSPSFQLDVAKHININNPVYPATGGGNNLGCYMIGSLTVLHNKGTDNICPVWRAFQR